MRLLLRMPCAWHGHLCCMPLLHASAALPWQVHVHLVDFFVLQRGARSVPGAEGLFSFERNSPKDVVFLGPSNELWLIAR